MNRLTAFLKKIRLVQILTVFLAGILVFVSTACNRADVAAGRTADQIREEVPSEAVTSQYKGGQNQYSDVDPRNPNMTSVEAKAQLLKEQAQHRIDTKSSNNVGENLRRVADEGPDKLNQIGQKVKEDVRAAGRNADEFGDNAKQGIANIKENTREGLKGAKDIAKEAGEGAKQRAAEGTESLRYNTGNGQENVTTDNGQPVKSNAEYASDKVRSKS
jgi:hypothetical protein